MQAKFVADSAVRPVEPGVYEGSLNRDWWIQRGPNGGFLAAQLMRAFTDAADDPGRQPRSLTIHYTAPPAEGQVRIATTVERAGRSLTTLTARMTQGDKLIALAAAAFSSDREGAVHFDDTSAPESPAPEDVPTFEPIEGMPPFSRQWETKPVLGGFPFSGGERAVTGGWIRPHGEQPIDGALVAQLTDAWIPAVFTRLTEPNAVPTIDLTVHFRARLPLPSDWVFSRFESRLARDGFVEEDGELWGRDGTLIAQSRQLALLQAPSQD